MGLLNVNLELSFPTIETIGLERPSQCGNVPAQKVLTQSSIASSLTLLMLSFSVSVVRASALASPSGSEILQCCSDYG